MGFLSKAFNFVMGSQVTQIILGILAVALGFKAVQWKARMDGEKSQRDKTAMKQARVRVKVGERQNEIISEERQNADSAIEARDNSPLYPDTDSMPDELRSVAIRNLRGGKAPQ